MSSQDRPDHRQALPAGHQLGNCRVVRVLGAGGFGITYLCEHARLGVQVAVKEYLPNEIAVRDGTAVHPKSAGDREGFEWGLSRFLDEARTLARFEHPNVVRVRDCFEANNTAYIVMDYEDGEPLDALLERHGTLTEAQLKRVVLPVADGLRQVHAAGFLHRDVKPSNIFVRRSDESPVLLDFGSARQALGRKSRSMTAIASAGYSPPEQYESQGDQGAWTDIYALSALCHRAITGEAPVEAPRRTGEVARSRADPQQSLAAAGVAGYSSGLLEAVDWGLRLVETERPQGLGDWLARMGERTSAKRSANYSSWAGRQADGAEPKAGAQRNASNTIATGHTGVERSILFITELVTRLMRGSLGLARSFWLFGLTPLVSSSVAFAGVEFPGRSTGMGWASYLVAVCYFVPVWVGIWRAASAYQGWRGWANLAQIYVLVHVVAMVVVGILGLLEAVEAPPVSRRRRPRAFLR